MTIHDDKASYFRSLHTRGDPLLLPNAWDVASARVIADAGAAAIATTSAGVAWSLGVADGEQLAPERATDLIARVAAAVDIPVTADIEGGYAETAAGVADIIRSVLNAGAVGVNIEDANHRGPDPLRAAHEQAERLAAARAAARDAGISLFINARIDTYLRAVGNPADRLQETLSRAAEYVAAGADGIFVPGVVDPSEITALVGGIDAPLNLMTGPGGHPVSDLAKLGVARVSLGPAVAAAAYALARQATRELITTGTYSSVADAISYQQLNAQYTHGNGASPP